jgi:hypothetical protein
MLVDHRLRVLKRRRHLVTRMLVRRTDLMHYQLSYRLLRLLVLV